MSGIALLWDQRKFAQRLNGWISLCFELWPEIDHARFEVERRSSWKADFSSRFGCVFFPPLLDGSISQFRGK